MGLRSNLISDSIKENNEEIDKKMAKGEKLSVANWVKLIANIGLLICSIFFGIMIIWLLISLL